jgi:hypothetical protein
MALLDFDDFCRRNAQRPVREAKLKRRKRTQESPVMHEIAETVSEP